MCYIKEGKLHYFFKIIIIKILIKNYYENIFFFSITLIYLFFFLFLLSQSNPPSVKKEFERQIQFSSNSLFKPIQVRQCVMLQVEQFDGHS
jgi:hypothetical protein